MRIVRKIFFIISKTVACVIATLILAIAITSFSPVYRFREPKPFSGPDIFNPYSNLDTTNLWKRANFHTHTRVHGIMNECEYWPAEVYTKLEKFGYDIVTFSNHNELTIHPFDTSLQVNVYEHGYNLLKYHKLIFGADRVKHRDHILPLFAFQKQFQINYLKKGSDLVQINHPLRTPTLSGKQMEKLTGYRLIELDSGRSTENRYWDMALSAGHYSFAVANDDLHKPDRSSRIAVRCCFLSCESAQWKDIRDCLYDGCFYCMRIPDYGHGDWNIKHERNKHLPYIINIGRSDIDDIFVSLSSSADSIKVIGQNHRTLMTLCNTSFLKYTMKPEDSYARIAAYYPDGEVIYTNAFARYDASKSDSPFCEELPSINIFLTILFNLALLLISSICAYTIYKLVRRK